jgi:hypothetical protein
LHGSTRNAAKLHQAEGPLRRGVLRWRLSRCGREAAGEILKCARPAGWLKEPNGSLVHEGSSRDGRAAARTSRKRASPPVCRPGARTRLDAAMAAATAAYAEWAKVKRFWR